MKVWSRGLGKQALNADWFKTDISLEGGQLLAKGIVRDKGIIWDCQFTFQSSDIPGLLHMLISRQMLIHILANISELFLFPVERFIKRSHGKKQHAAKPKPKSAS